eukprot:TRINITY_DN4242_c0_g1_i1.p1 TRINITY_DN4242_c0_g1~~TRINITY_DN4242_c0_g1_i1.p1  ORF type:complete len:402 (+),score=83.86 TRINITY_DN4242_c0_g1_i1:87-1208(+)
MYQPPLCEPSDLPSTALLPKIGTDSGLTDFLSLPSSFGAINSGETFTSYISLFNKSNSDVLNVMIKADLEGPLRSDTLLEVPYSQMIPLLKANQSIDYIVQHEVQEEGMHMLVCNIHYNRIDGEKKLLKKSFKFQVDNPFDIKYHTHRIQDKVHLEIQLLNNSKMPLYIDSLKFEPSPAFSVTDSNNLIEEKHQQETSPLSVKFLKQSNSRHYLYTLTHNKTFPLVPNSKDEINLGQFSIVWKSNFGETGRLTRSDVNCQNFHLKDVEVQITGLPATLNLEEMVVANLFLTNRTLKTLNLGLFFNNDKMSGILITGLSGKSLGQLSQSEIKKIPLTLFPVKPGVQKITGIKIVDMQTGSFYEFDDLVDVYVNA